MPDLDRLLRADISHAAAEAAQPPDFDPIAQRGLHRRRTHLVLMAAVTVAVVALVATGVSVVGGFESTSPPPASPGRHSPGTLPSGDGAKDQAIEPGTYRVRSSGWSAVDFTVTFSAGWTVQYGHIYHSVDGVTLEAAVVDEIFTDACHGPGVPTAVGPRVEDLVAALRSQAGPRASRPVQTRLGGYPATRIDLRAPKSLDLTECRGWDDGVLALQVWYVERADNYLVLFADSVVSVYVLEVGGKRQVFVAQIRADASEGSRTRLQSVLDSIRIER